MAQSNEPTGESSLMSWFTVTAQKDSSYYKYVVKRLEVGTRITHLTLLDDTRGTPYSGSFVGTVTQLREDQDFAPVKFYIQYKVKPYFGLGLSYDKVAAEAGDWGLHGAGTGGSDGTAKLSGPLVYLLGCYPTSTKFTPFCEVGTAFYSASFDYSGTLDKAFLLNSAKGFYLAVGCDWDLEEQFSVNVFGRYMHVSDVTGSYYLNDTKQDNIIFTMSNLTFGLGAKFIF